MMPNQPESLPARATMESLGEGTTVHLIWPASAAITIDLDLIYDTNGKFTQVTLTPRAPSWGLPEETYPLPMRLETTSKTGQPIEIISNLVAAGAPYAFGIWVNANTPGFIFAGQAVEFSANADGPPPRTVW